jgi:tetratricopeptide (TPR) repeat protein
MSAMAVAIVLTARCAMADPIGDLEKAYGAYAAHKYSDAEARLRALLDGKENALKDPDSIADARMYLGAVLVAEGKRDEASEVFENLLKEKPDYEPDKLRVQLDAIDAFIDVHTRLRAELGRIQAERVQGEQAAKAKAEALRQKAALRLAMLERMVSEERVVDHNSRWRALVPFGVGQFQNGQRDLGLVFLSSEALLALGSAVAGVVSVYDQLQRNEAVGRRDGTAPTYNSNAQYAAYVSDALAGGFLLTAIIGAVHAELTFVPELVSVRKRTVPSPALAPVAGPGWLGLTGRF